MPTYVALLRAVNVGGTGKLPMPALKAMADELGWTQARTYIASGNLLFQADAGEEAVRAALEDRLAAYAGKPVNVLIRTAAELSAAVAGNPYPDRPGNTVAAIFLPAEPPPDAIGAAQHRADEEIAVGPRLLYVSYGSAGMGRSRLVIPAARAGTARNMNTVTALAAILDTLPG